MKRNLGLVFVAATLALGQGIAPVAPSSSLAPPDPAMLKRLEEELAKDPQTAGAPPGFEETRKRVAAVLASDGPPSQEQKLPPAAERAISTAEPWKNDVQTPAPGKDGRVMFTFGEGLATIVCAPLRLCVLELEPGEQVLGEPHIGDSVRWSVSPAVSGTGASAVNLVVVKPKEVNLDTNLLVPTNRRAYYVRLVSRASDYVPLVAFHYPEDEALRWKQALAAQERTKEELEASNVAPVDSMANLNFNYSIAGGTEFLRPVRVVDDGHKTFIQMPEGASARELPVLVVAGLDGSAEMVNYRVKGSIYLVDRLFDHGALLLGTGKHQQRVDIVRSGKGDAKSARVSGTKSKPDAIEQTYLRLQRKPAPPQSEPSTGAAAK